MFLFMISMHGPRSLSNAWTSITALFLKKKKKEWERMICLHYYLLMLQGYGECFYRNTAGQHLHRRLSGHSSTRLSCSSIDLATCLHYCCFHTAVVPVCLSYSGLFTVQKWLLGCWGKITTQHVLRMHNVLSSMPNTSPTKKTFAVKNSFTPTTQT